MKESMKEVYKDIDEILTYTHDINYYLPYIPEEYYSDISNIRKAIEQFRNKCIKNLNTPLIALKNYTEHKCSWERAGMMCDLHIFGLRAFCEEHDVDWGGLRIDEYYGVSGKEGIKEIKENWEKLDPNHEFQPIKYEGDSLFTKYPFMEHKSKSEYNYNDANDNYIKYKAKMLISEYSCEFYKAFYHIVEKNPELEDEYTFYKNHYINEELSRMADGLEITDEDDLMFLEHTIGICELFLKDARDCNDLENVLNSFFKLKGILKEGHYEYTINQEKKPTKEDGERFFDMIRNMPKGD